ncbi:hypothetical protein VSAK1_26470 [Vibrio mediterranei AK1]|jgi:hypothetical protein|uniref:hypothetical protein n=1 Tax=Vibrio mediterranei TaxID=689 RepID=UPI00015426F9|nr:hypothetical protein [Vibrio mediterranei]EDL52172.1 hypothetical protein VSAK1_26470 [Vibrio mediterranei AK1]
MYALHFKPLIKLWDHKHFQISPTETQSNKPKRYNNIDGIYTASCLFSLESCATNPKLTTQAYSRAALEKFLDEIRKLKKEITALHAAKLEEWGDIDLVAYSAGKHTIPLTIEDRKLCRSTGLLIKTFHSANLFLLDLYKAQHNEEISNEELLEVKTNMLSQLQKLMTAITSNTKQFHIERKRLEGAK